MRPVTEADPEAIGPYRLLGVLGVGGMGTVYLGVDGGGRRAAVKVVNAELLRDEEFHQRFVREASATAAVSGRFIAGVVASDLTADRPWLATEYIDGPALSDVVTPEAPLPPARAQEIAAGLAEALCTIHAAGVVHRDVKPANVLLAASGPHLIDFGIARESDAATITRSGVVVGTPPYMAPEQIRGRRPIGPPADVFALGGVLAFAITGRHPFGTGEPAALAYRITHEEPDLDGIEDEIIRTLIIDCLAKKAGDRPTAIELRKRLASEATRAVETGVAGSDDGDDEQLPTQELGPGDVLTAEESGEPEPSHGAVPNEQPAAEAEIPPSETAGHGSAPSDSDTLPAPAHPRRRRLVAAALTALAVVVLSAGIIGMDLGRNDSQASATGHHSKGGPMPSTSTGPSTASSPTIPGSTAPPAQKVTVSGSTVLPIGATGRSNPNPDPNSSTSLTTGIVTANGTTTLTHATTPPTRSTTPAPPPTTSAAPTPPPPQGNPPQSIQGAQKQVQPSCTCLPQLYDARISWFLQSDATAYDVHYTYPGDTSGDPSLDKTTRVTDNSLTIPGFHARPDNLCYAVRAVNEYGTSQWTSLDCYT